MQLKKYTAQSMAEAMGLIRQELGPDAVILSSRKIKNTEGESVLEVTAALERNTAPTPEHIIKPQLPPQKEPDPHGLSEHLHRHGIDGDIREKIEAAVQAMNNTGFSSADTLEMVLGKMVPFAAPADVLQKGKIHVFVGPTGGGKTTTIAKLSVNKRLNRYSVGMLSWDYHKVGGFDQLNTFADAMREQAFLLRTKDDLDAANLSLGPKDFIFVDTPGLNLFSGANIRQMQQQIDLLGDNVAVHLVLPCTMNPIEMAFMPAALQPLNPQSVIFTKMDETTHLGGITNVAAMSNLKVCYITDGSRVPNDICELNASLLAKKLMTPPRYPWEKST